MGPPADPMIQWLAAARAGSPEALGQALEACRAYLLSIASQELSPDLRAKGGASDLVQEALVDVCRAFPGFVGDSTGDLRAWLRQILRHNLVSFARRYRGSEKRAVAHEIALSGPSSGGGIDPPATGPSPSGQAGAREEAERLRQAAATLPDEYRQALTLRYQEGLTFEEMGRHLGLTPNAARKLWARAVSRLRQVYGDES